MNKNKVYTHVSLFSGAGGLDIGLEQAGFHTVWANDFNHDACETHRLWSNATVVEGDIGKVDYNTIPDCDIASFGFPCQGFSLSGPRKIDDSRNVLYRHCVKLVEKKQPKLFLSFIHKALFLLAIAAISVAFEGCSEVADKTIDGIKDLRYFKEGSGTGQKPEGSRERDFLQENLLGFD